MKFASSHSSNQYLTESWVQTEGNGVSRQRTEDLKLLPQHMEHEKPANLEKVAIQKEKQDDKTKMKRK